MAVKTKLKMERENHHTRDAKYKTNINRLASQYFDDIKYEVFHHNRGKHVDSSIFDPISEKSAPDLYTLDYFINLAEKSDSIFSAVQRSEDKHDLIIVPMHLINACEFSHVVYYYNKKNQAVVPLHEFFTKKNCNQVIKNLSHL